MTTILQMFNAFKNRCRTIVSPPSSDLAYSWHANIYGVNLYDNCTRRQCFLYFPEHARCLALYAIFILPLTPHSHREVPFTPQSYHVVQVVPQSVHQKTLTHLCQLCPSTIQSSKLFPTLLSSFPFPSVRSLSSPRSHILVSRVLLKNSTYISIVSTNEKKPHTS